MTVLHFFLLYIKLVQLISILKMTPAITAKETQQVKSVDVQKAKPQSSPAPPSKPKGSFIIRTQVIKNTAVNKPTPVKLAPQVVEDIPNGMATDDYKIEAGKVVCFYGKDHFLSTLYPADFVMDDNTYLSVEHYYQACKLFSLAGPEHAVKLQHIVQPIRAKTTAKKILYDLKVSNAKVEQWKVTDGFNMLRHAINYKFAQNPELSKKLLETGDAILAQAYDRDTFYACGADKEGVEKWAVENDGKSINIPSELTLANVKYAPLMVKGRNMLGVICMNIRKAMSDLATGQEPDDPVLPPIDSLSLGNDNKSTSDEGQEVEAAGKKLDEEEKAGS